MPLEHDPTEVTAPRSHLTATTVPELIGVVTSRKSAVISAQVQARIEKLAVRSGQAIKAGDRIATLDRTELENRLAQAVANEKSAQLEAGAYGAQAQALRQRAAAEARLHKLGVSSAMAVSSARAEYAQIGSQGGAALAKAITAKAAREQSERDLARAEIVAPLDGIVTQLKAHEGEVAQIGTPLARVFDPSDLIVRFAVPRERRDQIAVGQRVELALDGDPRTVAATVTNISAAQEPPVLFSVVEADIDDSKLSPGQLTVAAVGRVRITDGGVAQ